MRPTGTIPCDGTSSSEVDVPHIGWLRFPTADVVLSHLREGSFEFREQAFVYSFLKPNDVFLDVGAHAGLFCAIALQVLGPAGRIHAVEPNPDILPYLRANVRSPKLTLHEAAVSDQTGESLLAQGDSTHTAFSSIAYDLDMDRRVTVRTKTLDDLLEAEKLGAVALAKLDVEGSEMRVLRGAQKTLRSRAILAFLVEFTEENLRKAGYSSPELYSELASYGYGAFKLDHDRVGLIPYEIAGSVQYENFVFTYDPELVQRRLNDTSHDRRRVATDIVNRGLAIEKLINSIGFLEGENVKRLRLMDALTAELQARDRLLEEQKAELFARGVEDAKRINLINELTHHLEGRANIIQELEKQLTPPGEITKPARETHNTEKGNG